MPLLLIPLVLIDATKRFVDEYDAICDPDMANMAMSVLLWCAAAERSNKVGKRQGWIERYDKVCTKLCKLPRLLGR